MMIWSQWRQYVAKPKQQRWIFYYLHLYAMQIVHSSKRKLFFFKVDSHEEWSFSVIILTSREKQNYDKICWHWIFNTLFLKPYVLQLLHTLLRMWDIRGQGMGTLCCITPSYILLRNRIRVDKSLGFWISRILEFQRLQKIFKKSSKILAIIVIINFFLFNFRFFEQSPLH